jgi:NAD(P)H dehydrogenase (quinone)
MKHLIVYTHPNPKSFNNAILNTIVGALKERGDEIKVSDLYEKEFNPVLSGQDFVSFGEGVTPADILTEQELVTWADNIIFVYPIWWFDRPALLKGWIDRVFAHGFAFNEDENGFEGLMTGKTAAVYATFGGTEDDIKSQVGLDYIMKSMTFGSLELVGMNPVKEFTFFEVPTTTDEERKKMLEQVHQSLV